MSVTPFYLSSCFLKAFSFDLQKGRGDSKEKAHDQNHLNSVYHALLSVELLVRPSVSESMAHDKGIYNSFHIDHHLSSFIYSIGDPPLAHLFCRLLPFN